MNFRSVHPLGESTWGHFPTADGQCGSTVWPSIWPVPLTSPPYLGTNEGTDLRGTDSLGCWS